MIARTEFVAAAAVVGKFTLNAPAFEDDVVVLYASDRATLMAAAPERAVAVVDALSADEADLPCWLATSTRTGVLSAGFWPTPMAPDWWWRATETALHARRNSSRQETPHA